MTLYSVHSPNGLIKRENLQRKKRENLKAVHFTLMDTKPLPVNCSEGRGCQSTPTHPASRVWWHYFASLCNYSHISQGETNGLLKIKWRWSESLRIFWLPTQTGLNKKEMLLAQMLELLEEKQASGLLSLCSTLCDFSLSLEPHQTSHQHITTSRRRQKEAGASGSYVLSMRRLLPEALGKLTLESPWLEPDYRTIAEASPLPS